MRSMVEGHSRFTGRPSPLPFRGGAGGGASPQAAPCAEKPHPPTPSPEEEGEPCAHTNPAPQHPSPLRWGEGSVTQRRKDAKVSRLRRSHLVFQSCGKCRVERESPLREIARHLCVSASLHEPFTCLGRRHTPSPAGEPGITPGWEEAVADGCGRRWPGTTGLAGVPDLRTAGGGDAKAPPARP